MFKYLKLKSQRLFLLIQKDYMVHKMSKGVMIDSTTALE